MVYVNECRENYKAACIVSLWSPDRSKRRNLNETYGKAEELLQQYKFLAERKGKLFILKIYNNIYFQYLFLSYINMSSSRKMYTRM